MNVLVYHGRLVMCADSVQSEQHIFNQVKGYVPTSKVYSVSTVLTCILGHALNSRS